MRQPAAQDTVVTKTSPALSTITVDEKKPPAATYTYDEVFASSLEYFNGDELAANTWVTKYALKNPDGLFLEQTPRDMHRRLAREFARIEKKYPNPMGEEEIFKLLDKFQYIVPQGSPMSGIGNPHKVQSISNCFVIESPADSYGGILATDQEQVQIMKRRGGVGFDLSTIRPKGLPTANAAHTTDGIEIFMDRFSNSCREVAQGGRRGALMLTLDVHHPQVRDFVKIKRDLTRVTGANISLRLSDEFMQAVEDGEQVQLRWPCDPNVKPTIESYVDARELWTDIIESAHACAEPGLLFWDNAQNYTPSDIYADEGFGSTSTNPCLTGDTLVAVADGRGFVPFAELAEDGIDVPVYCCDGDGRIAIRTMRRPRKTGTKRTLKVTLDDGTQIRCTENHKFMLRDGSFEAASKLQPGASLHVGFRAEASIKDRWPKTGHARGQDYFWLSNCNSSYQKGEHRLIWEAHNGSIPRGHVIHHVDFDASNNAIENLSCMSKAEHDALHAEHMLGDGNPIHAILANPVRAAEYKAKMSDACSGVANGNSCGLTNDQLIGRVSSWVSELGYVPTVGQYIEQAKREGWPQILVGFRNEEIGSLGDLVSKAAVQAGVSLREKSTTSSDPLRRVQYYRTLTDLPLVVSDGEVFVEKSCEECGSVFHVAVHRREQACCSQKCANRLVVKTHRKTHLSGIRRGHRSRMRRVREEQLEIYTSLRFQIGRAPLRKEWEQSCREREVPFGIRRSLKYGFKSYRELQEAARTYNHRVVSVEEDAISDVFNGTVDDFHNFYTGGRLSESKYGKPQRVLINSRNCGEIILSPNDSCRLMVINLSSFVKDPFSENPEFDFDHYDEVVMKAQRLMDDMIDLEIEQIDKILNKVENDPEPEPIKGAELHLWRKIRDAAERGRRTGLGVTAVGDTVAMMNMVYGSDESIELVEKMYQGLAVGSYRSSVKMAAERGCFPVYEFNKEKGHPFIERVLEAGGPELRAAYEKSGRRNIANTTTAPCGSVSILTQTTSGIEPAYTVLYTRRKKINPNDEGAQVDFIDDLGDKWTEFPVRHHGFAKWQVVTGKTDKDIEESPYWGGTSNDINWVQKVKLQGAAQRWICHAISNCVAAGESLIFTDQGLLDIEELAGHAEVGEFAAIDYAVASVNKEGETASITQAFNNGVADVLRIQCEGGRFITCTPNHQLVVLSKNYEQVWKKAGEIQPGDLVVGRKGLNLWNPQASQCTVGKLVGTPFTFERTPRHKDLRLPKRMTSKLARFIGYMCSDGFLSETGIGLSQVDNDAAQDFVEIVNELFEIEVSPTRDYRAENLYSWRANSKELAAYCSWLGLTRHDEEMRVPLAIRRSSKRFVKEFVRGLTLDGHVSEGNLCVMTSVSRRFLEQTQALLLNMGIDAHVEQCHEASEVTFPAGNVSQTKDAWALIISHTGEANRFLSMVGYAEDRKAQEAVGKFRRASRVKLIGEVPDEGIRAKFRASILPKIRSNSLYGKFNSLTSPDKQGRMLCRESLLEMVDMGLEVPEILLDTSYAFRRVESVTPGREQTYDVTVPQGHAYIANGFVSHNTTNLPADTDVDTVKDVYMTGWKSGCKGVTVYRDGSRAGVLVQNTDKDNFHQHDAPKRPERLPCEVHRSRISDGNGGHQDWIFFVGLLEGKPFEIFGGTTENIELPKKVTEGHIVKRTFKTGGKYDFHYGDLEDPFKIKDIVKQFDNPDQGWATRMISLSLRHGSPIQYVVEQLQRDKGADLFAFSKCVARVLKKYIPDGAESRAEKVCPDCGAEGSLRYQEGCVTCSSCGYSKCG